MDCETAREHMDAAALGALDAEEARAFSAHVASCTECTRLLDSAREAASSLGLAVPLHGASATLKSRVMASAGVLTDMARGRAPRWWQAAVAAALIVGVGAVAWGAMTQRRVDDLESRNASISADATAASRQLAVVNARLVEASSATNTLEDTVSSQQAVLDVVMLPDLQNTELIGTVMAPYAKGRCLWSRQQALGAFLAEDLPPPPAGWSYQMWIVYEDLWLRGGSFDVDDDGRGRLIVRRPEADTGDLGAFVGFAVTMERSQAPSQPGTQLVLHSPAE